MKTLRLALSLLFVLLWCSGGGRLSQAATPASVAADSDAAFLDISSEPPARILVDEADTGKTTPQHRLALPAGHHTLTLVTRDGAHKRTIGITLKAGQTKAMTIHFAS
jgi:hypothetical protein